MANFKVQKKDGTLEDYQREKLTGGVVKSGATPAQAENVAVQVEKWAATVAIKGVIKAMDLRAKVLNLLKTINAGAAKSFETYRKPDS